MNNQSLGLDNLLTAVSSALRGETMAIVLFGSVARGDAGPSSDIDILQLSPKYRPSYNANEFCIAVYTPEHLTKIAMKGSLFVLHLKREAKILHDPKGKIAAILSQYVKPESYNPLIAELREAFELLNVSQGFYSKFWRNFHRLSVFLLRSVVYAIAADEGMPCFSIPSLAERFADPNLVDACQIRNLEWPDYQKFIFCTDLAKTYLQKEFTNEVDSVESIICNAYGRNDLTVSLGLRLMNCDSAEAYGEANV